MDPVFTPLLLLLGFAGSAFTDGIKDFLKDAVKEQLNLITEPNKRASIERAYATAMETGLVRTLDAVLQSLRSLGYTDAELKDLKGDIEAFARDPEVARLLLREITEPGSADGLTAEMLTDRWDAVTSSPMPEEFSWTTVQASFRRQARNEQLLSDELRAILTAQNVDDIRAILTRIAGPQVRIDRTAYARSIRRRYAPVDLANLMPATEGDIEPLEIRDVFVAPYARENPPPVEIPRDVLARLAQRSPHLRHGLDGDPDPRRLAQWQAHTEGPLRPVLDVLADPKTTRLVLTGDPGAGKSTLLRYLVTGLLAPPTDASGVPLPWTAAFAGTFPLLIELRDFHALREKRECNTFLDYVKAMGRSENWGLDDTEIDAILRDEPALVLFDGLDEVFDGAARARYIREIAAFADRYPRARVVVTTRPLGYRHDHLRNAGFALYALQDLDDDQIRTFVSGWFRLTFPHRPDDARQRTERVLQSIERSRSIRLLAGNPMLLTLMALLARERDLPRERVRFYEQAVDVLCHHWDLNRHLQPDADDALTADDKRALLRQVAQAMQEGDGGLQGNVIDHDRLRDVLRETMLRMHLSPDEAAARARANAIIERLRERNQILCLRGPGLYGFVHRTFLEYLAADAVRIAFDRQPQALDRDELLRLYDDHAHDETWHEVLRLLCGSVHPRIAAQILDTLTNRINHEPNWTRSAPIILLSLGCLVDAHPKAALKDQSRRLLDQILALHGVINDPHLHKPSKGRLPTPFANSILDILNELGPEWIDSFNHRSYLNDRFDLIKSRASGRSYDLGHLAHSLTRDRGFITQLCESVDPSVVVDCLSTLAKYWPDGDSRDRLRRFASDSKIDGSIRQSALYRLAKYWPDNDTRERLRCFASEPNIGAWTLRSILTTMARFWPDNETREHLNSFTSDPDIAPSYRERVLSTLAEHWPDNDTRERLSIFATDATIATSIRLRVLQTLVHHWRDDGSRSIIEQVAGDLDSSPTVRRKALHILVLYWPDSESRAIVKQAAGDTDSRSSVRQIATKILGRHWPDQDSRIFVEQILGDAKTPTSVQMSALSTLVEHWPDEDSRKRLVVIASDSKVDTWIRERLLSTLARLWPDLVDEPVSPAFSDGQS